MPGPRLSGSSKPQKLLLQLRRPEAHIGLPAGPVPSRGSGGGGALQPSLPAPGGSRLCLAVLGLSLCHSSFCLRHHKAPSLGVSVSSCGLPIKTLDPV